MSYEKLNRAENRLSRNLQNNFWGFVTFTSFHLTLLGFCFYTFKEMPSLGILLGIIPIIAGTFLHITSLMTLNTYRTKLIANEKTISRLEKEFNDPQQSAEENYPKIFLSGAGKARKLVLWGFWIVEMIFGLFVLKNIF